MITLNEVINLECLRNLEYLAGPKEYTQPIVNVAFMDYEPLEGRYNVFLKHEFIITSLLFGKDNPALVREAISKLVQRQVGAIAIQKVHNFEIDEELKEMIHQSQTTVFQYKDIYMEDIISGIKHLLYKDKDESKYQQWIDELMRIDKNDISAKRLTHELVNDSWQFVRCQMILPNFKNEASLQQFRAMMSEKIVRIYSYYDYYLLIEMNDTPSSIPIPYQCKGISDFLERDELCYALKQAMHAISYAKENALVDVEYDSMYSRIFSYATKDNWLIQHHCQKQMDLIQQNDDEVSGSLMQTLRTYIACHGNVKQCGVLLYQHPNTIRYRIGKIKSILQLEEQDERIFYEYLFLLVHLYKG